MPFSAKLIRRLRGTFIVLACLATLIAVAWQIENFRGQRAWHAALKTYADRGDPLDALPGPTTTIPSDKNFWHTPILSRLAFARHDSRELNEFKAANPFFSFSPPGQETWENGRSLNLDSSAQAVVKYRHSQKLPEFPPAPNSASLLLTQFSPANPVLAELRTAALNRPDSRLIRIDVPPLGQLFDMGYPSFPLLRHLTRGLQIQACASLSSGDTDTAFSATLAALQLANGLGDHPYTLVEAMIAVVVQRMALQPLWEGIQQRAWTDAQLAHFTIILSRSRLLEGLAQSLRKERNNSMFIRRSSLKEKQFRPYRLMPEGWWQQNQVTYADMHQPVLLALASHSTPAFLHQLRASNNLTPASPISPYRFFAWAFLPAYEKVTANTARSANATRLALTACALERHYLARGVYPDSLTALVPTYLSAVPLDVIDGAPLRYRRNDDGTFNLYSIALDGDDDNGRRASSGSHDLTTDGDWAW